MKKLIEQVVRFVFVGGTATLLDMLILYILNYQLQINHLVAATIAFMIATFYNYALSMKFVFQSKFTGTEKRKEFIAFFILSLCGLGLTLVGLAILVDWLHLDVMFSKIIIGVFVMMFNFVSRKIYFEA